MIYYAINDIIDCFKSEKFIVEMQRKDLGNFTKRSLYYTSKAYVEQLPRGNDYTSLKKVYFIGIVNFEIFSSEDYISRHLIINQESAKQDLNDFEFIFVELPKFKKEITQLQTILDKWIYFIKYARDLTLIPKEYESKEEFKEAFEIAQQTTWNSEELKVYEYMALREFDEINALRTAEQKGLEKGLEQGMEKGKQEEKLAIAKNLLQNGVDIETIIIATSLDRMSINSLMNES